MLPMRQRLEDIATEHEQLQAQCEKLAADNTQLKTRAVDAEDERDKKQRALSLVADEVHRARDHKEKAQAELEESRKRCVKSQRVIDALREQLRSATNGRLGAVPEETRGKTQDRDRADKAADFWAVPEQDELERALDGDASQPRKAPGACADSTKVDIPNREHSASGSSARDQKSDDPSNSSSSSSSAEKRRNTRRKGRSRSSRSRSKSGNSRSAPKERRHRRRRHRRDGARSRSESRGQQAKEQQQHQPQQQPILAPQTQHQHPPQQPPQQMPQQPPQQPQIPWLPPPIHGPQGGPQPGPPPPGLPQHLHGGHAGWWQSPAHPMGWMPPSYAFPPVPPVAGGAENMNQ